MVLPPTSDSNGQNAGIGAYMDFKCCFVLGATAQLQMSLCAPYPAAIGRFKFLIYDLQPERKAD